MPEGFRIAFLNDLLNVGNSISNFSDITTNFDNLDPVCKSIISEDYTFSLLVIVMATLTTPSRRRPLHLLLERSGQHVRQHLVEQLTMLSQQAPIHFTSILVMDRLPLIMDHRLLSPEMTKDY